MVKPVGTKVRRSTVRGFSASGYSTAHLLTVLIRDLRWYTSRQHGQLSYLSGPIAVVPYSVVIFALRWALRMSLSVSSTTASVVHTIVHDERQTVAQPWAAATSFVVCV